MRLIERKSVIMRMAMLMCSLMVAGCSTATRPLPTYPTNLNVIELSDGGVCFDADSATRLKEFRADLEAW
ncbi:hypothetical protein ACPV5U_08605 [Vibrio mediterranei]